MRRVVWWEMDRAHSFRRQTVDILKPWLGVYKALFVLLLLLLLLLLRDVGTRTVTLTVGRNEFRKHRAVDKKDFSAIEYLLRRGRRQLDMYEEAGVRDVKG